MIASSASTSSVFLRASAAHFLAAAQFQVAAQIPAGAPRRAGARRSPGAPSAWKFALLGHGKAAEQTSLDHQAQHGIAQEFQLLVVGHGGRRAPLRVSLASELWVSARRSNSGLVNRYFSFTSRVAGSARMQGEITCLAARALPPALTAAARICVATLLDLRVHVGIGQHLVAPRDGFVVLAGRLQRRGQAHHVRRLGTRIGFHRALERRRRRIVLLARQVRQADGVVGFGRGILLRIPPTARR